jgi:hypothetical protein
VKFDSWENGFRDLAHRLIAKDYVYAQEGRKTITQIIERFGHLKGILTMTRPGI